MGEENSAAGDIRKVTEDILSSHKLPTDRLFYSLPAELLARLQTHTRDLSKIDPILWQLELKMSELTKEVVGSVGYWNGQFISYTLLSRVPAPSSQREFIVKNFCHDPAWRKVIKNLDANLEMLDGTSSKLQDQALVYCGWLLTNPQFILEHDDFFRQWKEEVVKYGLPRRWQLQEGFAEWFVSTGELDEKTIEYAKSYGILLDRWKLLDLQSPCLPEPLSLQFPILLGNQIRPRQSKGGQLMFLPNTSVLPNRDTLHDMVAGVTKAQATPDHLKEWIDIVQATQNTGTRISRFARLFRLQHYWHVMQARWGERLPGSIEKLQCAFASWLVPDSNFSAQGVDTIRKDLRFIATQRGRDWYRKASLLNTF